MPLVEKFNLAALCLQVGRRQAVRLLQTGLTPAQALAAAEGPRQDPLHLAQVCARHRIDLLAFDDARYPRLLHAVPDAPAVLYYQGQLDAADRPAVAIVGARRCTRLGAEVAGMLAGGLAQRGLAVVSGLARGIDAAAHRAALEEGRTVAVLGSGLARPYPAGNRDLVRAILRRGGLIISEYPPLAPAQKYHFPERNRVISGLSLGVVVVEAGEHSGSLITARMALEQGREVLAVPGPITSPASRGCHRLLREGAALVESVQDVLGCLGFPQTPAAGAAAEAPTPERLQLAQVLAAVAGVVTSLDEVVAATGLPGPAAAASLVELELSGFVRQVPGGYIRRPSHTR